MPFAAATTAAPPPTAAAAAAALAAPDPPAAPDSAELTGCKQWEALSPPQGWTLLMSASPPLSATLHLHYGISLSSF